jgi:hypothetical protein
MKEIFTFGLVGFLGISLGALLKFRPKNFNSKKRANQLIIPELLHKIEFEIGIFTVKEITCLEQLIQINNTNRTVSTPLLIDILEIHYLPHTQKRIECNRFLKNLNLKILVRYGLKDAIVSLGTDLDKRKKCYQLDARFFQLVNEKKSVNAIFNHIS